MTSDSAKLSINSFICLLFLSLSLYANSAIAKTDKLHNHQDIIQVAKQFLYANIDADRFSRIVINMGHLDSRLRLAQCDIPLTTTLAPGSKFSGKTTTHVRCNSLTPWTVYLGAHIGLFAEVIQTAEPLDKGHIIRKEDLMIVEADISRLKYGYYTKAGNLIGKQLKRRLPQNRVIKANHVKSPTLVKRGELVSIISENKGYSVKMTGTAMMNGARGERIRVKNNSSRRVVEGIVKESGIVSIN